MENTPLGIDGVGTLGDHLHIRGEYTIQNFKLGLVVGSPPHTWRILTKACHAFLHHRITSTYVENTIFHQKKMLMNQDHLHIRGEYTK